MSAALLVAAGACAVVAIAAWSIEHRSRVARVIATYAPFASLGLVLLLLLTLWSAK